ncbi:MAG: flagellar regulator YcgR PilZN domain-containing protein [Rubrivivax sp.]
MQFLDTKPFALDEGGDPVVLAAIERYRVSSPDRMRQMLAQLQRQETPIVIGLPEKGEFFTATLWSVDAAGNRLTLHAARAPQVLPIVTDAGRLWAAAYEGNHKVQFDVRGRTIAQQGDTWVVGSHMPSALFALPRRTDVRARHAEGREPMARFRAPGGEPLELRVHDISRGGLALLAGAGSGLEPGTQLHAVEIELDAGEFFYADFQVQNVQPPNDEGAHWRIGCAWTHMSPQAGAKLAEWTQRARRRKQLLSLSLDL